MKGYGKQKNGKTQYPKQPNPMPKKRKGDV